MSRTKRLIAMLLAILMLVSLFPTAAFAEDGSATAEETAPVVESAPVEEPYLPAQQGSKPNSRLDDPDTDAI